MSLYKFVLFATVVCLVAACKPGKKSQAAKGVSETKVAFVEVCIVKNKETPHTDLLAETSDAKLAEIENDTELVILSSKEGTWVVKQTGYVKPSELDAAFKMTDPKTKALKRKVVWEKDYRPTAWRKLPSEKIVFGQLERGATVNQLEEKGVWVKIEVVGRTDKTTCLKRAK